MKVYQYSLLWFLMVVLTLVSFIFAKAGYEGIYFVVFVLVAAVIKGQIIIEFFMQLKWSALLWRLIVTLWLAIVLFVIGILYLLQD